MKLNELVKGTGRARKRLGRGSGSGLGKTSGRGHKGQKARTGGYHKVAFEGGQMPLYRRLPKRGFVSRSHPDYAIVNLRDFSRPLFESESVITPELLIKSGLIKGVKDGIKVLGVGDLSRSIEIHAHLASSSAKSKIEAAGGKLVILQ